MGQRANLIIVEGGQYELYYDHWCANSSPAAYMASAFESDKILLEALFDQLFIIQSCD